MPKIEYIFDKEKDNNYKYDIDTDTIIHHFSINSSSDVEINLIREGVTIIYYYHNINYDDNTFKIRVNHQSNNTHSELFQHGVNVNNNRLNYYVDGVVPKTSSKCIANQENQIININDGKSTICPNLLIDNYDVDSSHAAYIGSFDKNKLFYLASRGISMENAKQLLLKAFLLNGENIDNEIRDKFEEEINKI